MTAYETVFSAFRDKVVDYSIVELTDSEEFEILNGLMKKAIAKFGRICKKLSERNDVLAQFTEDLTDLEIDVVTELMVENWVKPKLYHSEKLQNSMSTKDFSIYSPANLLNQLRELNKDAKKNARALMNEYSLLNSNYENMSTRQL